MKFWSYTPPPPRLAREVDGTSAYLLEKGETASSLLVSTVSNYFMVLLVLILLHALLLALLKRRFPKLKIPPILLFPRLEVIFTFHAVQGLILSAVGALKRSCQAGLVFLGFLTLVLHFVLGFLAIRKVRSGIEAKLAEFQPYDPRHRRVLLQKVSGHLRDAVALSGRTAIVPVSSGNDGQEINAKRAEGLAATSAKASTDSTASSASWCRVFPRIQLGKLRDAYQAYKEAKAELAEYKKEIGAVGEWVQAAECAAEPDTFDETTKEAHVVDKSTGMRGTKLDEEKAAASLSFMDRQGHFFEEFIGSDWWFFAAVLSEKLLVAIITPSFSETTIFPGAQVTLLLIVEAAYTALLIWRRPFTRHMDNIHHIMTKSNHVLVHFAIFVSAMKLAAESEDEVAQEASSELVNFVTTMQMLGTAHLLLLQVASVYSMIPNGTLRGIGKLFWNIRAQRPPKALAPAGRGRPAAKSAPPLSHASSQGAMLEASPPGRPPAKSAPPGNPTICAAHADTTVGVELKVRTGLSEEFFPSLPLDQATDHRASLLIQRRV